MGQLNSSAFKKPLSQLQIIGAVDVKGVVERYHKWTGPITKEILFLKKSAGAHDEDITEDIKRWLGLLIVTPLSVFRKLESDILTLNHTLIESMVVMGQLRNA